MTNVLILGAGGQIARVVTDILLKNTNLSLCLYLRHASRIQSIEDNPRVTVIEGDVLNLNRLSASMKGIDIVYANLSGEMELQSELIIEAMKGAGLKRLIFVSSMGIYNEVPGENHGAILGPYRNSVAKIEASKLDYTIIRPAWLNNKDEIDYGITHKGATFKNSDKVVSRKSVADLIVRLITTPGLEIRESLGVHKS